MTQERWDVIVAGAGHNSLIATAYLAKAWLRCLVLEARQVIGGNTATQELTSPGFRHDSCSTAHNLIQASPTLRDDELGLRAYGLEYLHPDPVVHLPFPDGAWLTQWRDLDATCEEFAKFSGTDADSYRRMIADYDRVKHAFGGYRYTPAGAGPSLDQRLVGVPGGVRWRRLVQRSAWDVIRDAFEDWHSQAFMLWLAFMTMQPVDRTGTAPLAYSLPYGRQRYSWVLPKGGSGALPAALASLIEDHGGQILTGRRVCQLLVEGEHCVGVRTEDGEEFRGNQAVLSTVHIKHLVEMAPPEVGGRLQPDRGLLAGGRVDVRDPLRQHGGAPFPGRGRRVEPRGSRDPDLGRAASADRTGVLPGTRGPRRPGAARALSDGR